MLIVALLLLLVQTPKPAAPFTTPLTAAEMANKQAVVTTTAGAFVIDLRPDLAPNHVGYFIKLAKAGAYDGTIFHRVIRLGIIQGGDPLSRDPSKSAQYGTGGLGVLKAEPGSEKTTRGAVAAVLQPGKPDSAGSQFFICVTDQPGLEGNYTIFGRVAEGLDVVQKISEAPADEKACPRNGSRFAASSSATRRRQSPTVRRRNCGPACGLSRGPRDVGRLNHRGVLSRQGSGARPQLPSAGCLRRL